MTRQEQTRKRARRRRRDEDSDREKAKRRKWARARETRDYRGDHRDYSGRVGKWLVSWLVVRSI